jgi:hypothetical protein
MSLGKGEGMFAADGCYRGTLRLPRVSTVFILSGRDGWVTVDA